MTIVMKIPKVQGRIGVTIGGGSPYYRCIFVADVQLKSPAAASQLCPGDEIVSVNGHSLVGSGKPYAARLVAESKEEVVLEIRRWIMQEDAGGVDIVLKSLKHRLVEKMSPTALDVLGLSHAVLVNGERKPDKLTVDLERLEKMSQFSKDFAECLSRYMLAFTKLSSVHRELGDIFGELAIREKQGEASTALSVIACKQRKVFMEGVECTCECKRVLGCIRTLVTKAIPDTRLTIDKYATLKFEYLAYCLRVHEMEKEEGINLLDFEPWSAVYGAWEREYRDAVYMRHKRRCQFNDMRIGVFNKIRVLEWKLGQDLPMHMDAIAAALHRFCSRAASSSEAALDVFPIPCTVEWGQATYAYVEKQLALLKRTSEASCANSTEQGRPD